MMVVFQDDYDETLYKKIGKQMDSLSKKDLQVLAIYRQMMSGSALDPQTIKNDDVSNKEYAAVSQKLSDLPGRILRLIGIVHIHIKHVKRCVWRCFYN